MGSSGSILMATGRGTVLGDCNLVERRFFGSCRMCPFAVANDGRRCLVIKSLVSPGQEVKLPFLIAWMNVDLGGHPAVEWRYAANSESDLL